MKIQSPPGKASTGNVNSPFFSKGGEHGFFQLNRSQSFFQTGASPTSFIQTRLEVNQPNDPYEKEADTMADKVVQRMAATSSVNNGTPARNSTPINGITPFVQRKCNECAQEEELQMKEVEGDDLHKKIQEKPIFGSSDEQPEDDDDNIQRKCAECEKEERINRKADPASSPVSSNIENALNSSRGSGESIHDGTRQQMESSFGQDFTNVRIHKDSSSIQLSKQLNAQAFTHGSDVYFNSGKYDTGTRQGQHLLAHELTHVVQQGKSEPAGVQREPDEETEPKIDKAYYEFIPTATLNITLGSVYFKVSPDATFQPGPKTRQIVLIILKKLVGDQFKQELVKPFEKFVVGDKEMEKTGHL